MTTAQATWTADEMMSVAASRALRDGQACFVGIGLPSTAANLARRLHAPGLVLIYESGTIGTEPDELPLSIGDGILADSALSVVSVPEIFNYWLQPGRIDVGFLSGAQIDRFGNQNIAALGDFAQPKVALLGYRGAPGNTINDKTSYWVPKHSSRVFVEQVDTVCGIGYDRAAALGPQAARFHHLPRVISDLAVFDFETENHSMRLRSVHPGVTVDDVVEATGFSLVVPADVEESRLPTAEELELIREVIDPEGAREKEVPDPA